MLAATLSEAIGLLYETCCDEDAWTPALEMIRGLLKGDRVVAAVGEADGSFPFVRAIEADLQELQRYVRSFQDIDPVMTALRAAPAGTIIIDRDVVTPEALTRSRFYAEYVKPNGMASCIQSFAFRDGQAAGTLFSARPPGVDPFGDREVDILHALLPHLARTLRLRTRFQALSAREADLRAVLDRSPWPALLLTAEARLVWANAGAEYLLRHGEALRLRRGVVMAEAADDSRRLADAIARATASDSPARGGAFLVGRARSDRPLSVLVVPVGIAQDCAGRGRVIIFLSDPSQAVGPSVEELRSYLDLTPSEALVTREICRGEGVASVAAKIGVGASTVKTHLLRVFAKAGVARQAELVRLVSALPWS